MLCRPLPGASSLLTYLAAEHIAFGIATTGKPQEIAPSLAALKLPPQTVVIDGSTVQHAKPAPDLFLRCQESLGIERSDCLVVGDSVWDIHAARRGALTAVGLLSGGFGEQELYNAGAMRVYVGVQRLKEELGELGFEIELSPKRSRRPRAGNAVRK